MTPKDKLNSELEKVVSFTSQLEKVKAYAKFRQVFLKALQAKEYNKLKVELGKYGTNDINEFFTQEGQVILSWATMGTEEADALSFLSVNIPNDLLQSILRAKDNYIFKNFLFGQAGIEGTEYDDEANDKRQIEKIKLLLSIDLAGITDFIKLHASETYVTKKIKELINIAANDLLNKQLSTP